MIVAFGETPSTPSILLCRRWWWIPQPTSRRTWVIPGGMGIFPSITGGSVGGGGVGVEPGESESPPEAGGGGAAAGPEEAGGGGNP